MRPLLGPQNNMEASVIQGLLVGMAMHTWAVGLVSEINFIQWNRFHGVKTYLVYFPETLYVYKKQDNKVS